MVRIIHLGDLHLGIKFHKRSLISDQNYVLDQIVDAAKTGKCHVVIAGDVFDTVNPSIEAQTTWFGFLEQLGAVNRLTGKHTFVIAGNHDSAARLSLARTFVESANIHIVDKDSLYQVFELEDGVKLVCVPFTKPETLESKRHSQAGTYDEAYQELLKIIREETSLDFNDSRHVLVAHQTFEGGKIGESEFKPFMSDAISLKTVERFPLVLAGHLHAHQRLKNVHYSGSLLPYAFGDEYNQGISVWEYSGESQHNWSHTRMPIQILHPLTILEGDLAHCLEQDTAQCYVKVKLTNCLHFEEALAKLQEMFPLLLSVTNDSVDKWVANLDKPVNAFGTVQEALDAFCDHLEIPRFTGTKKKLIQEALDAFTQYES